MPGRPKAQVRTLCYWLGCILFLAAMIGPAPVLGQNLRLEIEPEWRGQPLVLSRTLPRANVSEFSLNRLDGLLSHLALQRKDGTWLETKDWHAFISAAQGKLSASADGLPAEPFQAIRFQVGLDAETDHSEPQRWDPEHPLHPDVCGLHWGWSSGYVFLALEGHWQTAQGQPSGFSYHLAGAREPMLVELPVPLPGGRPATVRLGFDVEAILENGSVLQEATSTHSRDGDPLALMLKKRVARSFRVKGVEFDLYQKPEPAPSLTRALPAGTTPLPVRISERLPKVNLPEDNALTIEGVALGQRLFEESKLSRSDSQSCASCHERAKGFANDLAHSLGESGQVGRRNAMPLANLAWAKEFFWDGRAQSLRAQVLMPIQDKHEMNETLARVAAKLEADDHYPALFQKAFGSPGINAERIALALEQFLLTLISQDSKFDRAARKLETLTAQEQRGLELFVTEHDPARGLKGADCFHCHGGNLFTNHRFVNNGLSEHSGDLGRMEISGSESDRGKFKVPSLRNVALTAPYMHDGRFATLEEVVDHYNGPLHRSKSLDPNLAKHPEQGLGLGPEDRAALVAFLKTLTDERFVSIAEPPSPQLTKTQ